MVYPEFTTASFLPPGKEAAICMTIDDIHPGTSNDPYEAGGDLLRGALGHLVWLLDRHPHFKVTLFTTADWRQISHLPTSPLRHLPMVRDFFFLTPVHPKGTMALDRHPKFVAFLKGLRNVEVAFHGLHHVHKGLRVGVEFQDEPPEVHLQKLEEMRAIFLKAELPHVVGMSPPTWAASPTLIEAMGRFGMGFLASSRDIFTPVTPEAVCRMSGLEGTPLIHPCRVGELVHIPTNFQATSSPERAVEILEAGGVLSIKAHIVKNALGHVALDAMERVYCNYLSLLFEQLEERFGDRLWWTTMGEINERIRETVWTSE